MLPVCSHRVSVCSYRSTTRETTINLHFINETSVVFGESMAEAEHCLDETLGMVSKDLIAKPDEFQLEECLIHSGYCL